MGKISKTFALMLILVMAISSANLIMVKPANAQSMPTPTPSGYQFQYNYNVTLNPSSGPPNTVVQVNCSGFYPRSPVNVYMRNSTDYVQGLQIIGQNIVDGVGNINFNITIPNLPDGQYKIEVQDFTPRETVEASFTISSIQTTPTPITSPTIPELPLLAVVHLFLSILLVAVALRHRKNQ